MFEAFVHGLGSIFDPTVFFSMLGAVVLGIIFGIIPGLGGMTFLAVLIPFAFGMDPLLALTVLLAGHAVVHTSGGISAILLNVPGTSVNAPTLLDGFPMAQQGKAGRAIGNAVTASAVGGVFGGIVMVLVLPLLHPIIMAFASPELFLLCILGITFIATLSSASVVKGLIAGAAGVILSLVGLDPITGTSRLAFGSIYLTDGIRIIPIMLGIFAVPEVVNLMVTGKTIAQTGSMATARSDLVQGVKDVFRHWWLLLRTSTIGALIGILPGIGAEVAVWVCYGHAKQTSRHPERFGYGAEEGIIAPEAANNSKEGGALIPTLGFGIPGSAGMAVLLGAFLVLGLVPGPMFLVEHMDICFAMVGALVISNIMAAIICLGAAQHLAKITFTPARLLAPVILGVLVLGTYCYKNTMLDIVSLLVFGAMGYAMARFGYPRPPFILGFILGSLAETYLHLSVKAIGPLFFLRPICLVLSSLLILTLAYPFIRSMLQRMKRT